MANELRQKIDQFTQQLVEDDQRKAFLVPDLPPLNTPIALMTVMQQESLNYWCEPENLTYVYIQLQDAMGRRYNANYLEMGQCLTQDMFVSAIESASGWCTDQQKEKIEQWIDQQTQFQHIYLDDMDEYGVVISTKPWSNIGMIGCTLAVLLMSIAVLLWSIPFGCMLLAVGAIWVWMLHRQDQQAQRLLDLQMWKSTLMSRMELYLEYKIRCEMQKRYHLATETEQQMQDDNVLAYELPEELQNILSSLEHHMFVEIENEQGNKELKNLVHYEQQHKHKITVMNA